MKRPLGNEEEDNVLDALEEDSVLEVDDESLDATDVALDRDDGLPLEADDATLKEELSLEEAVEETPLEEADEEAPEETDETVLEEADETMLEEADEETIDDEELALEEDDDKLEDDELVLDDVLEAMDEEELEEEQVGGVLVSEKTLIELISQKLCKSQQGHPNVIMNGWRRTDYSKTKSENPLVTAIALRRDRVSKSPASFHN